MATFTKTLRHRINVSKTSTGKYSFDCTVEFECRAEGCTVAATAAEEVENNVNEGQIDREISLTLSDQLMKELEQRYPIEAKNGKEG